MASSMMYEGKSISIIIPFFRPERRRNLEQLRDSLNAGTIQPDEIIVVENTAPVARARNIGADRSKGDILVFCDDDAIITDPELLRKVVSILLSDDNIGLAGTAIGIPENSSRFQRQYGRQCYRTKSKIVSEPTDYDMITPLFCAVRRSDFDKVGGFNEILTAGEDLYFCHSIRKLGKRVVTAPDTIVYHPLPKNMKELIRKEIWYGSSKAHIADVPDYPTDKTVLRSKPMALLYLLAHSVVFPLRFFVGGPDGKSIGFWHLRAIGHYVHAFSYAITVLKSKRAHEESHE